MRTNTPTSAAAGEHSADTAGAVNMRQVVPDGVLLSRELRTGDDVTVALHRFRPVEVAVPTLVNSAISLHLNGPNRVVQWRDGRTDEWIEYPGEIAIRPPVRSPFVQKSLAVSEDINVLLSDRFVWSVAGEAGGDPRRIELMDTYRRRDPQLERLLLAILPEIKADGPGGRLVVESLATALTVHLLRYYSSLDDAARADLVRPPAGHVSKPALRRVIEYIEVHLDRDLGIAELATLTDYSPRHFARLFRATTGFSPRQYVIRRRVERARLLLATTDQSVAQVALDVGFAHQSHLASHFRRLVGVSPTRYRR